MAGAVVGIQTTDIALEFSLLATALLEHSAGKPGPTFDALANFANIGSDDPLFFEIIGMIGSRAVALVDFIQTLEDDYLDEDLRISLIAGVREMTQVVNPANMVGQWNQVAPKFLSHHNIRALRLFSRTARQYKPLRLVSVGDRDRILQELNGALEELRADKHFPSWAISQLEEGIRRLRLMITHFNMFGHDAILDQLIKVQAETKANFDFLQLGKDISEHKLTRTLSVLSLIVGLLVLPPKVEAAIPYYRQHVHQIVQEVPKLLGGSPKQITHQPAEDAGGAS